MAGAECVGSAVVFILLLLVSRPVHRADLALLAQTHENLEHLAMMEAVVGPIPDSMGRRAARDAEKYFRRRGRLAWPEAASSRKSVRAVQRLSSLQKHIAASCDASLRPMLQPLVRFQPRDAMLDAAAAALLEALLPASVNAEAF